MDFLETIVCPFLASVAKYHVWLALCFALGLCIYGSLTETHPLYGRLAFSVLLDVYLFKVSTLLGLVFFGSVWFVMTMFHCLAFRLSVLWFTVFFALTRVKWWAAASFIWGSGHIFNFLAYGPWYWLGYIPLSLMFVLLWHDVVMDIELNASHLFTNRYPVWSLLSRCLSEALSNLDWVGPLTSGWPVSLAPLVSAATSSVKSIAEWITRKSAHVGNRRTRRNRRSTPADTGLWFNPVNRLWLPDQSPRLAAAVPVPAEPARKGGMPPRDRSFTYFPLRNKPKPQPKPQVSKPADGPAVAPVPVPEEHARRPRGVEPGRSFSRHPPRFDGPWHTSEPVYCPERMMESQVLGPNNSVDNSYWEQERRLAFPNGAFRRRKDRQPTPAPAPAPAPVVAAAPPPANLAPPAPVLDASHDLERDPLSPRPFCSLAELIIPPHYRKSLDEEAKLERQSPREPDRWFTAPDNDESSDDESSPPSSPPSSPSPPASAQFVPEVPTSAVEPVPESLVVVTEPAPVVPQAALEGPTCSAPVTNTGMESPNPFALVGTASAEVNNSAGEELEPSTRVDEERVVSEPGPVESHDDGLSDAGSDISMGSDSSLAPRPTSPTLDGTVPQTAAEAMQVDERPWGLDEFAEMRHQIMETLVSTDMRVLPESPPQSPNDYQFVVPDVVGQQITPFALPEPSLLPPVDHGFRFASVAGPPPSLPPTPSQFVFGSEAAPVAPTTDSVFTFSAAPNAPSFPSWPAPSQSQAPSQSPEQEPDLEMEQELAKAIDQALREPESPSQPSPQPQPQPQSSSSLSLLEGPDAVADLGGAVDAYYDSAIEPLAIAAVAAASAAAAAATTPTAAPSTPAVPAVSDLSNLPPPPSWDPLSPSYVTPTTSPKGKGKEKADVGGQVTKEQEGGASSKEARVEKEAPKEAATTGESSQQSESPRSPRSNCPYKVPEGLTEDQIDEFWNRYSWYITAGFNEDEAWGSASAGLF